MSNCFIDRTVFAVLAALAIGGFAFGGDRPRSLNELTAQMFTYNDAVNHSTIDLSVITSRLCAPMCAGIIDNVVVLRRNGSVIASIPGDILTRREQSWLAYAVWSSTMDLAKRRIQRGPVLVPESHYLKIGQFQP